jgi:hypothetical protein
MPTLSPIHEFLKEWWACLSWQVRQTVPSAALPELTGETLYAERLGQQLLYIAQAANGLIERTPDNITVVLDAVRSVTALIFSRPGMPDHIPPEFWSSPVGALTLRAHLWACGDKLITMQAAAEMTGRSLSDLSNSVDRGRLTAYPDPNEPNPRKRNRLRRSEVAALKPPRRKA